MRNKEGMTAGLRVRLLRETLGKSRPEFSALLDFDYHRLSNIENGRARVGDDLLERLCPMFPELTHWIAYGGDISQAAIRESSCSMVRLFAAQIDAGMAPENSEFERVFVE